MNDLRELLTSWPNDDIDMYEVTKEVNSVRNTGAHLIEPA